MSSSIALESVDKEGNLLKKPFSHEKKKRTLFASSWKTRFFILKGGSLFYYKKELASEPKGVVHLKGCIVEKSNDKANAFSITRTEASLQTAVAASEENGDASNNSKKFEDINFIVAAKNEQEMNEWIEAIKKNLGKEPSSVPLKNVGKKTESAKMLTQRLVGNAAASSAGKALIKDIGDGSVQVVLDTVREFIEKESDDAKKAKKMEGRAIKVISRAIMIIKNKEITDELARELDDSIHVMCGKLIDAHEIGSFAFDAEDISKSILAVETVLLRLFQPYFTETDKQKMKTFFAYFESTEILTKFFKTQEYESMRTSAAVVLRNLWQKQLV